MTNGTQPIIDIDELNRYVRHDHDETAPYRTVDGALIGLYLTQSRGFPTSSINFARLEIHGLVNVPTIQLSQGLTFKGCRFLHTSNETAEAHSLVLDDASLAFLKVSKCEMASIRAHGISIRSRLEVRDCGVGRQLWFVDARIGGSAYFNGTVIHAVGCEANALNLYRAEINGAVYMERGFEARGKVRLIDATVKGVVSMVGARVEQPGKYAISADRLRAASVFLRGEQTYVNGGVSMVGARVDTTLSVRGATFMNLSATALRLSGIEVGHRLMLDPACVEGAVRLTNSSVNLLSYGPLALASCRDLDAAGLTFRHVSYRDPVTDADVQPPSRADLIDLLCRRNSSFSLSPYTQLAAALRAQGDEVAAREVAIAASRDRIAHESNSRVARAGRHLFGWPFAYGYRPQRAVVILLVTMASVFLLVTLNREAFVPRQPSTSACGADHPCLQPLAYAIDVVLPIVDLGQESAWRLNERASWGGIFQTTLWLSIAIGWIASTAFVVAMQRHFRS